MIFSWIGKLKIGDFWKETSALDCSIVRFDIEGDIEIYRTEKDPRRTDWYVYVKYLSNNMHFLEVCGNISNELILGTVVECR